MASREFHKQLRQDAQNALMSGLQAALSRLNEGATPADVRTKALHMEAVAQFRRVEKLFGYEAGSWNEGV